MTVRQLLDGLDSRELVEWMAFSQIEPFDEQRGDLRAGIIAATVANAFRSKGRAYQPKDFMPDFNRKAEQTWDQVTAYFIALAARPPT